ncbi:MAG: UDP-2,3-diacylglucosamine diphosphatase [Pseudomonadota bacterium]
MSDTIHFIADLHLADERPEVTQLFADYLSARRDAQALYILGDLFEFWIGDDDDAPIAQTVADLLRAYSDAGPQLYLMHGNRDFLIGDSFVERVGATLLDDPTVLDWESKRILLMHGDSLCTADQEYQAFRAMSRSSEWQTQALTQTLEQRRALALQLRAASKHAGSRKPEDIMDVTIDEAENVLNRHHCQHLIHGHTHRPAHHQHEAGQRWVLGDWESSAWVMELSDQQIKRKLVGSPQD